jgi:tRNA nucleotidyltransferase (CCA-adding enzyme)
MDNEDILSLWQKTIRSTYGRFLTDMAVVARSMNIPLYLVGGFLRDMIIGHLMKETIDLDIVVEGDALAFADVLQKTYGGRIHRHQRFGTANWFIHEKKSRWVNSSDFFPDILDIISARREFYRYPGALPVVLRGSIADDLDRRDFSINTLAMRLDTAQTVLIDRHNALKDIKTGTIRVLHDRSFIDDPTRIFRAVRYEQRYQFHIDDNTGQQLLTSVEYIKKISADRIRNEINHILEEKNVIEMLERLEALGILTEIQSGLLFREPQKSRVGKVIQEINAGNIRQPILTHDFRQKMIYTAWLTSFEQPFSQACAARLNLPASFKRILDGYYHIQGQREIIENGQPIDVTEFLESIPLQSIRLTAMLEEKPAFQTVLQNYLLYWRNIHPSIKGEDLKQRGVPSGPAYAKILRRLRTARLNGIIHSHQGENEYLDLILAEMKNEYA